MVLKFLFVLAGQILTKILRNYYLRKSTVALMKTNLKQKNRKERKKEIRNQLQQNLELQQIINPRTRERRAKSDELVSCDKFITQEDRS